MIIPSVITSSVVGIVSGSLYGLFFLYQRRRVFFLDATAHPAPVSKIKAIVFSLLLCLARLSLLAFIAYYVLRMPPLPSILILVGFLIGFWFTIFNYKALLDERRRTF